MSHAVQVHETGGPEVLRWEAREPSEPGPGQVRVALAAAGLNYIDVYFRTGLYPRPLPFVAGLEGAGTVEAVGPQVRSLAVGDRVAWSGVPGSYAEQVLGPAEQMVRVPEGVPLETAAAVMLQGMTAHYLVHGVRSTSPGDVALVHAGAGGVGLLLLQMLRAAGVHLIATCSSAEKEAWCRQAGADHVVRYTECDFPEAVREITQGAGCHVVYDSVGQSTFDGSLACLRPRGQLVLFGQSSGPVPPFEVQRLGRASLFLTRPSLAHYVATREELEQRAGEVLGAVASGGLRVRIGARFPLDRAPEAHRVLEGRATIGKVLLLPPPSR